jgi:hypothetical protein
MFQIVFVAPRLFPVFSIHRWRPAEISYGTLASSPHFFHQLRQSLLRSSVTWGITSRTFLPSLLGLIPKSAILMAFSMH